MEYCAGGRGNQKAEQRAEAPGGRRGRNRSRDHFAISEKNRDLPEKNLQISNQCSNGDGPKSKSAWFFKLYNFSLRFICS
jgi:hypothetical protein